MAHEMEYPLRRQGVAATAAARMRSLRDRSPSGAPPRLSPKTSRPWLGPVPRFMEAPTGMTVRLPGSELLADRRRGRPGGFPNRPNAVCETARGRRSRSTFRIASGTCPWTSERRGFYWTRRCCQALSPRPRQRFDSAALSAPPFSSAAAPGEANSRESTNHRASLSSCKPWACRHGPRRAVYAVYSHKFALSAVPLLATEQRASLGDARGHSRQSAPQQAAAFSITSLASVREGLMKFSSACVV